MGLWPALPTWPITLAPFDKSIVQPGGRPTGPDAYEPEIKPNATLRHRSDAGVVRHLTRGAGADAAGPRAHSRTRDLQGDGGNQVWLHDGCDDARRRSRGPSTQGGRLPGGGYLRRR